MENLPVEFSALLIGTVTYVLTFASKKTNLSQTWIAMILSLVVWAGYYVAINYYNFQWESLVKFVGGVYASSQLIYNLIRKIFVEKKTD